MNNPLNNHIDPVCRFGPGGDFTSVWPGQTYKQPRSSTNLPAKPLTSIIEIITIPLGLLPDNASGDVENTARPANQFFRGRGKSEYTLTNKNPDEPTYAALTTVIKGNRSSQGQTMLFADDWAISARAEHKPKHHIRAYRQIAKKKPAPDLSGQSSLFETNLKTAKIA